MNSLAIFELKWLRHVLTMSKETPRDLHIAFTLFEKYVHRVGLYFYQSTSDLAADAGVSLRSLQMTFARLEDNSLLVVDRQYGRSKLMGFQFTLPEQTT